MLKKIFIFFIITFLLTGCSTKQAQEEITFSSWGSISEVKILEQIIKDFEKENPKIKINFMHIPQNYFQKIHLLFASNTAPDVIFINNLHLPLYSDLLENLDGTIIKEEFYPAAIKAMSQDGKLLAIPRDLSNLVVYVNLEQIELPQESWTLENLLDIAKKTTSKDRFGIGAEEDIYWALPYLVYYSGGILNQELENILDLKESQDGLKFYLDLKDKYKVAPTKSQVGSSTLAQMFLDKKIAMYISGRWIYPKISENASFNWAVINFPTNNNPQYTDASGWAISKNSKHKETALNFIKYLSCPKSAEYFAKTGLIVPARIQVAQILNNEEHNQKIFLNIAESSTETPINKNYKKLTDKINSKYFK